MRKPFFGFSAPEATHFQANAEQTLSLNGNKRASEASASEVWPSLPPLPSESLRENTGRLSGTAAVVERFSHSLGMGHRQFDADSGQVDGVL